MKRKGIFILCLLLGLCLLNTPFILQYFNQKEINQVVKEYNEKVSQMTEQDIENQFKNAQQYNENLADQSQVFSDSFQNDSTVSKEYNALLEDVMGYIEIPEIAIQLPIYHGTSQDVLQKGVGHLYGSSLPIGGPSTHAVLSSHTGLPDQTLFTDLDKLKIGDQFVIHVYDYVLTYDVFQINIVEPDQTDTLKIVPNQDYVTLVTCTPYGVNTKRLLVTGKRTSSLKDNSRYIGLYDIQKVMFYISVCIVIVIMYLLLKKGRSK